MHPVIFAISEVTLFSVLPSLSSYIDQRLKIIPAQNAGDFFHTI